jgi:hypothetical protein
MPTSIQTNAVMASVVAALPSTNITNRTGYMIRNTTGGLAQIEAFFTRPFPLGAVITDAKLIMPSGATAQTGSLTLTARRIQTAYSASTVTWNNRPTAYYAGTATVTKTGPITSGTEWSFDVTAMMQSVALGDPWYGFDISSSTINPKLDFGSPTNPNTALRPRLEVTWSDAPDKPRTLAPAGGRAVSVAKPILRFDYVDVSGNTEMQSLQVQINSTSTFTSPAFDSGTVASSTPQLDLNATAYGGLTDGQVVYWRARVQDMAGLWSEWSDPVSFNRDGKGTLTLTAPSSGTPTVEDSTPPFTWTFTGETQSSYQLTIETTNTSGQVTTWTTGKITAATLTVTPPAGVIVSPDATYKATLRVWDAKQRESTPNDPAYVEVVRSFTYVPTATVTATTSPTATSLWPYPRVQIGWQRATAPDSFSILRNRQVIASGVLPGDVLVSGTTYAWVDKSAPPQITLTYEVQAVVNSKASASNPTVVTTMKHSGIWLADELRTNEVLITGKADRPFVYGEDSERLSVVGSSESILVTQSLRGLEGTVTGELHGNHHGLATTAQQWRDKLLAIKAKPGRKCWLTVGDSTIQCVIHNVSCPPRPTAALSFNVSFDFFQVGALPFVASL